MAASGHDAGSPTLAVQRVFAANRALFETIELAVLAFDEKERAEALCRALRAGELPFPVEVPANPQVLPEHARVGYLGLVTRADLPAEAAEAVFADAATEIVGPVRYDGRFYVYQRLMPKGVELSEAVVEYCERLAQPRGTPSVSAPDSGSAGT